MGEKFFETLEKNILALEMVGWAADSNAVVGYSGKRRIKTKYCRLYGQTILCPSGHSIKRRIKTPERRGSQSCDFAQNGYSTKRRIKTLALGLVPFLFILPKRVFQ